MAQTKKARAMNTTTTNTPPVPMVIPPTHALRQRIQEGIHRKVGAMRIRDTRNILTALRTADEADRNRIFFPVIGITLGEFCVYHVLTGSGR